MSRQAARDERRRRIAEAVCALAGEHGIDGITLRDVATRAEVSMGAVQRCFHTKDEMLIFALDHVAARVAERMSGGGLAGAAREVTLLGDPDQARVWLTFVAQAAVNPRLAEVLRGHYAEAERAFAGWLPVDEARALLALADGLTAHVLVGHLTPDDAAAVLRAHLGRTTGRS